MASEFQLNLAIDRYLEKLSVNGAFTNEDLSELKSHLEETSKLLIGQGLAIEEAFEVAKLRLGKTQDLVQEFEKVNGVNLVNKESLFIFIGIGLTVFFSSLLLTSQLAISYFAGVGVISKAFAAYSTAILYVLAAVVIFFIAKKPETISKAFKKQLLVRKQLTAGLFAGFTGFFLLFDMSNFLGSNFTSTAQNLFHQIIRYNRVTEFFISGSIPIAITLAIFFSIQGAKYKIKSSLLFKSNSYLYVLLLGFFWEALAASSRMLIINLHFSAIGFGLIYFVGVLFFTKHNTQNSLLKLTVFCSTTLVLECFSGYFYTALPPQVARLTSPYAWAALSAIFLGYFIGKKGAVANVD